MLGISLFNFVLAMPEGVAEGTTSFFGKYGSMIFLGVMFIGLIVLMIVPQRKREKKIKAMMDSIKKGDRIRTIGGIYGTVLQVKEDIVTVVVGPDEVKLVFAKGAIATVEDSTVEKSIDDGVNS